MAVFTITPSDSEFVTDVDEPAFASDSPAAADSLIVQSGAYLVSEGASTALGDSAGAFLAATGA